MSRKKFYGRGSAAVIAALVVIVGFALTPVLGQTSSTITLGSTTDTVVRGYFAADVPPVLRIKSGQTVAIDTISLGGIPANESPIDFFGRYGIPPEDVLPEAVDIHFNEERPGLGPHLVTGPIYIGVKVAKLQRSATRWLKFLSTKNFSMIEVDISAY